MNDIVLYCKSYRCDLYRAARLADSVRRFNTQNLPFYLSCPASDLELFRNTIGIDGVIFIEDEEIIATNPALDQKLIDELPGVVSQQIVKSEFWRLGFCENYLCLDSDSYFIRNFGKSDFLTPEGVPYTVMNDSMELRLFGALHRYDKIARNIDADCKAVMNIFGRHGKQYEFGPLPVVWSKRVWSDLAEKFLEPRGMNFFDAMKLFPSEMRWYGEALLKFRSIELWPVETLFRCYHYEHQYIESKKSGETDELLSQIFLGVVKQSAWDKPMEYGYNKSILSRLARKFKRRVLKRLT